MNLTYVAFDVAVAVIAVRSVTVLGRKAPWTSAGWSATVICSLSAAAHYAQDGGDPAPGLWGIAKIALIILTACFIIAAIRDEPSAEPFMWPRRIGLTRAQKR